MVIRGAVVLEGEVVLEGAVVRQGAVVCEDAVVLNVQVVVEAIVENKDGAAASLMTGVRIRTRTLTSHLQVTVKAVNL